MGSSMKTDVAIDLMKAKAAALAEADARLSGVVRVLVDLGGPETAVRAFNRNLSRILQERQDGEWAG